MPVAYGRFHEDFLEGKVVLIGCPKFDDLELYEQRFVDIFAENDIDSVTVMVMEVPCCQGLPYIVEKAMRTVGKNVPMQIVVVGLQGEIVENVAQMAAAGVPVG